MVDICLAKIEKKWDRKKFFFKCPEKNSPIIIFD